MAGGLAGLWARVDLVLANVAALFSGVIASDAVSELTVVEWELDTRQGVRLPVMLLVGQFGWQIRLRQGNGQLSVGRSFRIRRI